MAKFIQEHEFINDNVNKLEERLNTQYARMLDSKPTYTTYFQINNVMSTSDTGFLDVESSIGSNSPVRYNEIKNFPLYGLEQIQLQLEEREWGMDTNAEGDGLILPQTIKPNPGDWFIIDYLKIPIMFYVDSVSFDTIKSNNYYKITYHIRTIDADIKKITANQVVDKFTCNIQNIGSIENVIIRDDIKKILDDTNKVIDKVKDLYKKMYYKNQYNAFVMTKNINGKNILYYDRSLSHFIQSEELYKNKYQMETLYILNEDYDDRFELEYEASFFKQLVERDTFFMKDSYNYISVTKDNMHTPFAFYRKEVRYIQTISMGAIMNSYIDGDLINLIKESSVDHADSRYNLISKYMNKLITTPFELENELKTWYMDIVKWFTNDDLAFRLIPMCIYCMQKIVRDFTSSDGLYKI